MTFDELDVSIDALGSSRSSKSLMVAFSNKMGVVRELFASVDSNEIQKAIGRASEKKAEISAIVAAKASRARVLSQVCHKIGATHALFCVVNACPYTHVCS